MIEQDRILMDEIKSLKEDLILKLSRFEERFENQKPLQTGMLFEWVGHSGGTKGNTKANPVMYHKALGLISLRYPDRIWDYANDKYPCDGHESPHGKEITYMEKWIRQGDIKRLPCNYEYTIKQREEI